jgi:hypothetical protein
MPFLRHLKTGVTLFVGQKSYDEHTKAEKHAEKKKLHDAETKRAQAK